MSFFCSIITPLSLSKSRAIRLSLFLSYHTTIYFSNQIKCTDSEFMYSSKGIRLMSFLLPTNNANEQFGSETIIAKRLIPIFEYSAASFSVKFNLRLIGTSSLFSIITPSQLNLYLHEIPHLNVPLPQTQSLAEFSEFQTDRFYHSY